MHAARRAWDLGKEHCISDLRGRRATWFGILTGPLAPWNGAAPTSNAIDETNCIAGFLIVIDIIDII